MPLIEYLSGWLPLEASRTSTAASMVFTWMAVAVLFLLAEALARHTVVYKRNNEGVLFALVLVVGSFYGLGYIGLLTFVAGTLTGAWTWISGIRAANAGVCESSARKRGGVDDSGPPQLSGVAGRQRAAGSDA